jgi:hypothetical protein
MAHNTLEIKGDLKLYSKNGTTLTNIFDLIYPVGSVILTTKPESEFNPANIYGGTWTKWTDGYLKVDSTPNATAVGDYTIDEN